MFVLFSQLVRHCFLYQDKFIFHQLGGYSFRRNVVHRCVRRHFYELASEMQHAVQNVAVNGKAGWSYGQGGMTFPVDKVLNLEPSLFPTPPNVDHAEVDIRLRVAQSLPLKEKSPPAID
jgi:hypothetical protein